MAKLIDSIGRWGIAHNMNGWILGGLAIIIVSYMVWDCVTEMKSKKGYRRGYKRG